MDVFTRSNTIYQFVRLEKAESAEKDQICRLFLDDECAEDMKFVAWIGSDILDLLKPIQLKQYPRQFEIDWLDC